MKIFYFIILINFFLSLSNDSFSQISDSILDKHNELDSIRSKNTREYLDNNVITNEVHNMFFRNIYPNKVTNEEEKKLERENSLKTFEDKIIDTILLVQKNIFGQNVYDNNSNSNNFELFLSNKLSFKTKEHYILNNFYDIKSNKYFSTNNILEFERLLRFSGLFHDVLINPIINSSGNLDLIIIIQDVFPWNFEFSPSSLNKFDFGVSFINLFGIGHKINTKYYIDSKNTQQKFGYAFEYIIPNVFKKRFVDFSSSYTKRPDYESAQIGFKKIFVDKSVKWAGGVNNIIEDGNYPTINNDTLIRIKKNIASIWLSRAFSLNKDRNKINSIIIGTLIEQRNLLIRPQVSIDKNIGFSNSTNLMGSIGYSKIIYNKSRLVNSLGKYEDIPNGISTNFIFGMENTEFEKRNYLGFNLLLYKHFKSQRILNFETNIGNYSAEGSNQFIFNFTSQLVSKVYHFSSFRNRNYIKLRYSQGNNLDETSFLTFNDDFGIRGFDNWVEKGNKRLTFSIQNNLFLPFAILGFRSYMYSLFQLGSINKNEEILYSPIYSGATLGISFKNENTIFDLIQFQYGFYNNFNTNKKLSNNFTISSIIPLRFKSLDISKPNKIEYN